jgi:UDPglucose 6-dehydrogenase
MQYADDAYAAAKDADAMLILSDWAQFAELDLEKLQAALRYPIVIDGRNLYDPQEMLDRGFTYLSVGRPAMYPAHERAGARRVP